MKTLVIAALCLIALPVFAAQPAATPEADVVAAPDVAAPAAPAVDETAAPATSPACPTGPLAEASFLSTLSTCTADCWDGSTVTCTGSSCQAADSACLSGQRGYCSSPEGGYVYCPVCSCPSPSCDDLDGQVCKPHNSTCYMLIGGACRSFTCFCYNGYRVCP